MAERISCFVMCGGVGSRLWPLSREDYPKQFHDLVGHGSMLASTVLRLGARGAGDTPVYVIASERHADRVRSDIAGIELAGGHLIFEPIGRNTAAAVAVAALETIAVHGDGLVLTVPSDHEISTDEQFWETVERGVTSAQAGKLVVFGIWPDRPETGYGYIEVVGDGDVRDVARFVEKPGLKAAKAYIASGKFLWNAGIFLFRATTMRSAFRKHQVEMWVKTERALAAAFRDLSGTYLPLGLYSTIPSISIDYAIMEHASDIAMVPASFQWSDLGSWQSLLDISRTDAKGNVVAGDVIAIDCKHSYLRSQGRLLSVVGLRDIAIVATADATFVAPVAKSQDVRRIVEQLERSGRLEGKFTPAAGRVLLPGACRKRVAHWLFDETLPLWSTAGVDERHGGFHEALSFEAMPLMKPKRMRTMARQVCAFSMAKLRGWEGDADRLIAHGITFMEKGRTKRGGWARMLHVDGTVADACEDAFDHACVMLMLAYAHQAGNSDALRLGQETFAFLDSHLEDERLTGFLETSQGSGQRRRSNSHMHLLEAFLAWYAATGERSYLRRAAGIIDLFRSHFFDAENWTVGEYFDEAWKPARGEKGEWTEPGHHFEWASLLVDFAAESGQADLTTFARPYGGTSPPMVAY
ncbi:AGE family epimerase/isomerase, partial [Sinorhizobium sp. CCBAU 05631]|uniref:AGE family epimerase/isomerase n=1 Tax=Sinorhizobium sp. CCBAU 05631 TaxID=794846 RepID=UPI000683567E